MDLRICWRIYPEKKIQRDVLNPYIIKGGIDIGHVWLDNHGKGNEKDLYWCCSTQFLHQLYDLYRKKYNDQFIIKNPGKKSSYLTRKESLFMGTLAHVERLVHKFNDREIITNRFLLPRKTINKKYICSWTWSLLFVPDPTQSNHSIQVLTNRSRSLPLSST